MDFAYHLCSYAPLVKYSARLWRVRTPPSADALRKLPEESFMRALLLLAAALLAMGPALARAQTIGPVDPGAPVDAGKSRRTTVNGVTGVTVRPAPGVSQGYLVPDAEGGYIYYAPGAPLPPPKADRVDSEEIRLYARELAAQITGGISGDAPLFGVISVPTAFVNQDTRDTSSFGRLMGEQMIFELNSRGFPVKEIRGQAAPRAKGRKAPTENLAVLAGTYYVDKENLFVNARLVDPSGRVLRTGSVLIPMTATMRRMLGIPDYGGLHPTPPTLIGARNVTDPPGGCLDGRTPVPFTAYATKAPKAQKAQKASTGRKHTRKAVKAKPNCPPGCEPIDTAPKTTPPTPPAAPAPGAK